MPSTVVESFKAQVIEPFRVSVAGRQTPLDYSSYLALTEAQRSGDEMPVVDTVFSSAVLRWLGFDSAGGGATYNRTRPDVSKPDFVAHGPIGTAFIWEDKATPEVYDNADEKQLREYMAGQSGYAVWSNARRILALRFDTSGEAEVVADAWIESVFGPSPGAPEEQEACARALELFKMLFERSRFFEFERLVERISCDEASFLARAAGLSTLTAQHDFIGGSRAVLDGLRLAALAQIQAALAESNRRRQQEGLLLAEWNAAQSDLLNALVPSVRAPVERALIGLEARLGTLHASEIASVEDVATGVSGRALTSQRQSFHLWQQRAVRINAAARGTRLEVSELDHISDAFAVWRERQPDVELATEQVFAEQVGYVFFVRLLLTRVLEDKGLLSTRIASDGGFRAWRELIRTYFSSTAEEIHSSSFMRLLSDRVSTYYQHFFHQPLFDWFLPDDFLLVLTLEFLGRYSFAAIGSDLLGFAYEQYIDRVARHKKGHFLTRPEVVEYMLDMLEFRGTQVIGRRLVDPACGSGSFLVHAAQRLRRALIDGLAARYCLNEVDLLRDAGHRQELARQFVGNVANSFVGMEINPFACYLAELNLLIQCMDDLFVLWSTNQFTSIGSFHIFNTDSLDLPEPIRNVTLLDGQPGLGGLATPMSGSLVDPSYNVKALEGEYQQGFFYVICNPPYVNSRKEDIPADYRSIPFFAEALSGDTNLYLLFIRLGLHFISVGGRMVFIVPLTLLGDDSSSAVRGLLTHSPHWPCKLVRFYTGNVLFEGVDQAVCIFCIGAETNSGEVQVSGGTVVSESRQNTLGIDAARVLASGPANAGTRGPWLVSTEMRAYDVWDEVRRGSTSRLASLWEPVFEGAQGDVNATAVNPFRVAGPGHGRLSLFKGEDVFRFAPLPLAAREWVAPSRAGAQGSGSPANRTVSRLLGLAGAENGFVLRHVARLNTRSELKATWFERDSARTFAFTNAVWRFIRRDGADVGRAKAIFALIASNVTCYLLNLFSTNNNIPINHLGLLPIPDAVRLDVPGLSTLANGLLAARLGLTVTYGPLGGKFPDSEGVLEVSPEAVLAASRLPTVPLGTLAIRGDVAFSGQNRTRLGAAGDRYLKVAADGAFAQVVPLFLRDHAEDRWGDVANHLQLPEPGVAEGFLARWGVVTAELRQAWDAFKSLEDQLDDAVCDWYQLSTPGRAAIAEGLPWTRV